MTNKHDFARFGITAGGAYSGKREHKLRGMVHFTRAVKGELLSRSPVPLKQRLRAWRRGFSTKAWIINNLEHNDPELYLTDLKILLKMFSINGFFNICIGDKLILARLLRLYGVSHPRLLAVVYEGHLYREQSQDSRDNETSTRDRLMDSLDEFPQQVFRPTLTGSGKGIFVLEKHADGFRLNGQAANFDEVCQLVSRLDCYLVTEFQRQGSYARRISPVANNTMRVLTLWDENHAPYIAGVAHRFGSSATAPIDLWNPGTGAVCAAVDVDKAVLGRAVEILENLQLVWTNSHPETGERIEGTPLPGLARCLDGVLTAAGNMPFCPMIGWDVILKDDGYAILEANTNPGASAWQVHKPLLADPRTRAFFKRYAL